MRLTGTWKNGVVVPDKPVRLPEGSRVEFFLPNLPLSEEFLKFAGCMEGNYPADYAARFDEYKRGKLKE